MSHDVDLDLDDLLDMEDDSERRSYLQVNCFVSVDVNVDGNLFPLLYRNCYLTPKAHPKQLM